MLDTLMILMVILLSGSIWGWALPIISIIHIILLILIFIKYKLLQKRNLSFSRKNLLTFITIFLVSVFNIIFISGKNPIMYWNLFISFISCFVIAETISIDKFIKKYINIMVFLSFFSLLFWSLSQLNIEFFSRIVIPGNGAFYRMNLLYIYRSHEIFNYVTYGMNPRNCGIFWEPGAFQPFINLSLFFFINNKDNKIFSFKGIVLILTILSTMSTTGYLMLMINMIYYFYSHSDKKKSKRILYFIIAIIVAVFILNTGVVTQKFSSDNASYNIRMNDNLSGIKASLVSPIFGLGYDSVRYYEVLNSFGIDKNSSGLFICAQRFGIIFAIWYTFMQCKNFINIVETKNKWIKLLYCIFLLLIFGSENLNFNHLFIIFAFQFAHQK